VADDTFTCAVGDDRAHLSGWGRCRPDAQRCHPLLDCRHERLGRRPDCDDDRHRHAALPGRAEGGRDSSICGKVGIGIRKHHEMVLGATQRLDALAGARPPAGKRGAPPRASDEAHRGHLAAPPPSAQRWAWLRAARASTTERAVVGAVAAAIVIVDPGCDLADTVDRWAKHLRGRDDEQATIGVARHHGGVESLRATYREALGALHLMIALGHTGSAATAEQLGIFGHMFVHQTPTDLGSFISQSLGSVIAHDDPTTPRLLATLEAYFAQAGHLANTARQLGIHINTLYGRLERLTVLLGESWQEPDRRLELHLAVRLHSIDRQLAANGRRPPGNGAVSGASGGSPSIPDV
jgi:hypothetical protein